MTGSENSAIKIWDVGPSGDAEWANVPNDGDVMFARTGRELVTSSVSDGMVTALDIDTGQQRLIGSVRPYGEPVVEHNLSPDGSSVAISYGPTNLSQKLSVRDVATGNEFFALDDNVGKVDWSPNGEYLAVGRHGSAFVYDRSGDIIVTLPGAAGQFGPSGLIATYGEFDPIEVWDWRREELIATLPVGVDQVAFDPSGERIATEDLEIWDVASEKLSLRLPYSLRDVTVAFSPDGTHLAVGSGDEVRVFDARSGAALQEFRHRAAFKVVFSPDGSMLASRAADGTRVWALDIDDLLEIARQNVTGSLSDQECRHYLHVAVCSTRELHHQIELSRRLSERVSPALGCRGRPSTAHTGEEDSDRQADPQGDTSRPQDVCLPRSSGRHRAARPPGATRSGRRTSTGGLRPMIDGWIEAAKNDERPTPKWGSGRER